MAKGVKPLTILVTDEALVPHLQGLVIKGHVLDVVQGPRYDRVVGSNCYRLTPEMLDNLPKNTLDKLVKEARAEKYGKPT